MSAQREQIPASGSEPRPALSGTVGGGSSADSGCSGSGSGSGSAGGGSVRDGEALLEEALVEWQLAGGRNATFDARALCERLGIGDLLPELQRRMALLERFDRFFEDRGESVSRPGSAGEVGAGGRGGCRTALPQLEGYRVIRRVGEGGAGVVFEAIQFTPRRSVAVKFLRAGGEASTEQILQFLREAEALAALNHPAILQIYQIDREGELPFIAMEFARDGSLERRAEEFRGDYRRIARLIATLADALGAMHRVNIYHCDVKPQNVLFVEDRPKLADFGLAFTQAERQGSGSGPRQGFVGTPGYTAPEQARGEHHRVGPWTDIYSLGAVMYELLAGVPPSTSQSGFEVLMALERGRPKPPSTHNPGIPGDLESICLKCLEPRLENRYASVEELIADLERFSEGRPVAARPASARRRLGMWLRRQPKYALALALAFAALAGRDLALWLWGR